MPPIIEFTAPPLPHYIVSGSAVIPIGGKHPSRQNIGAFDLLVVEYDVYTSAKKAAIT